MNNGMEMIRQACRAGSGPDPQSSTTHFSPQLKQHTRLHQAFLSKLPSLKQAFSLKGSEPTAGQERFHKVNATRSFWAHRGGHPYLCIQTLGRAVVRKQHWNGQRFHSRLSLTPMAQLCWVTMNDKHKCGSTDWQKESVITELSIILRENEI